MSKKRKKKRSVIEGVIKTTPKGTGFLVSAHFDEDVLVPREFLNTALNNDIVEVALHPRKPEERQTGEVVRVVQRARYEFVGTIDKQKDFAFLSPDSKYMYIDIFLPPKEAKNAKNNHKALVRIKEWKDPKKNPRGEIVKLLGEKGKNETEMEAILMDHGFEKNFSEQVLKEAEKIDQENKTIPGKELKTRLDLRMAPTCTIDPETAKDFDDALSVRKLGNGRFEIGVHIADVSHYVRAGTTIDKEAKKRGLSVYLVDRTIPMLPPVLSDGLCSLNPEEDKLVFSSVFEMDENSKIFRTWFGKSIIRSDKRFSYEEAQKVIDSGKGPFVEELKILNKLSGHLRKKRISEGSIEFEQPEVEIELDKGGKPVKIRKKERLGTHRLVEDMMLMANKKVAEHIATPGKKRGIKAKPFVYRVHDLPDPQKIENLSLFLRTLSREHELRHKKGVVSSKDINDMLDKLAGKPEESMVQRIAIRTMAKAIYSTDNDGHFGLGFEHYTHFTSPIRRYPDLMVHRLLEKHLKNQPVSEKDFEEYEKDALHSTQQEIKALEAERDSVKLKQVEFMSGKIGKNFKAVVAGITESGVFVEEAETLAQGMVRVRDMNDDYYILNEKQYALVGQNSKKRYRLGDKVNVKLVGASQKNKTLDFIFVD